MRQAERFAGSRRARETRAGARRFQRSDRKSAMANMVITDDTRMRESLPTINYLREHGAKTILMAHFGRPKGKPVEKYSLRPVGAHLARSDRSSGRLQPRLHRRGCGKNRRGHAGRRRDAARESSLLCRRRSKRSDVRRSARQAQRRLYVNDAFGAAHRAHASTAGITKFVKQAAMGFLMEKELKYLQDELAQSGEALSSSSWAAPKFRTKSA